MSKNNENEIKFPNHKLKINFSKIKKMMIPSPEIFKFEETNIEKCFEIENKRN